MSFPQLSGKSGMNRFKRASRPGVKKISKRWPAIHRTVGRPNASSSPAWFERRPCTVLFCNPVSRALSRSCMSVLISGSMYTAPCGSGSSSGLLFVEWSASDALCSTSSVSTVAVAGFRSMAAVVRQHLLWQHLLAFRSCVVLSLDHCVLAQPITS
jgi:hypothetical protein